MSDGLARFRSRIENQLGQALTIPDVPDDLISAMRYAVESGGKRLRPCLVYLTTEALGGDVASVDKTACAIELIHTYSLVHDDLPSMDDDELRRGKPTCHIKFGEAVAILAGDALQTLAFELVAGDESLPHETRTEVIRRLAHAVGASGMVGGQAIDLASENQLVESDALARMHQRKTGALIACSIACGAVAAGASEETLEALERFGHNLGLAFQVKDDILDEIGESETMGKPQGSDRASLKSTFVSLHGLNRASAILDELRIEAISSLEFLGDAGRELAAIADFVASRDH